MARIYEQLVKVFKGEAPVDSVPATVLEFNIYKRAELILAERKQFRDMMINEYPQPISDLIRECALRIHAAGRAKRLGQIQEAEKVRVHRPEWQDWA